VQRHEEVLGSGIVLPRIFNFGQPPIQWVPGSLSLEVKRLGPEADHSPLSSAEVQNAWRYTSALPMLLNGVVLN